MHVIPPLLGAFALVQASPSGAAGGAAASPVVVTARSPAMWKLQRGGSTVWVLGAVQPLPRGLAWNSAPLARVIAGANLVLLPPEGSGGLRDAISAFARSKLPGGARLDDSLPPQLDARYKAALVALGRPPDRPRRDKPGWAALFLEVDFVFSRGVDIAEPARTAARLAHRFHVKVQRVADYRAGVVMRELVALPQAQGEAALAEASDGVLFGLTHLGAAGRAWAVGDLAGVRANTTAAETPLATFLHTPTGAELGRRAVDDTTGALRSALARPGVAVAVVRLDDLLQRGGALDRLRGEGVSVTPPSP